MLSTVVHRARALCDELEFLKVLFRQNGYQKIHWALSPPERVTLPSEDPALLASPFISMTFNCISRFLYRHNIKLVGLLLRKISSFLQVFKDGLGLQTLGVYSIPVSVVRFALDRPAIQLKPGSVSTISIFILIIQTSQPW
jgi:hypothetical protein